MAIKKSVNIPDDENDPIEAAGMNMSDKQAEDQINSDFKDAPLTPEQQSEKDTLDGHNAALRAINGAVPEINKLNHSVFNWKKDMTFKEFLKLSPEEQKARMQQTLADNDAQDQKNGRKRTVNTMGDDQDVNSQDSTQGL